MKLSARFAYGLKYGVVSFLVLALVLFSINATAQTDTVKIENSVVFQPDPITSGRASILLPGLGQIKNHQVWKVPIIYGAFAGMGYLIYDNKRLRDKWADYYARSLQGEEIEGFVGYRTSTFKNGRDTFDKYYQLSIFGTIAVYLLQGVDAYVSAHLKNFDIDEDLTIIIGSPRDMPLQPPMSLTLAIPLD